MAEHRKLQHPWLIAVWPGMGQVALNAGIYLLSKLDMSVIAELESSDIFDIDQVEVKEGIVQPARQPRNRFFSWTDPNGQHDLVIFLGETQPPIGKYAFCRQIMNFACQSGVERIFTFAAMATQMHPEHPSRVFAAATDGAILHELTQHGLDVLDDGHISGLNGILTAVAAEHGVQGACLLGEMPHIFSQLPFPKASLAILQAFTLMAGIEVDFAELSEHARALDEQLGELLARVEKAYGRTEPAEEESYQPEPAVEAERLSAVAERRIEALFKEAGQNRSKAFELKQELDRLGVFKEYEDRFLDLFKPGPG
jgi:proteasome assembly chaperone (PAC2) family protein